MKYAVTGLLIFISFVCSDQTKPAAIEVVQLKVLHYMAPCWDESFRLCYLVEKIGGETENFLQHDRRV